MFVLCLIGTLLATAGLIVIGFESLVTRQIELPRQDFTGPVLGRVVAWEKDWVSVAIMGRGDAEAWLVDDSYNDLQVLPKVFAPRQIWAQPHATVTLSLCLLFWPSNCTEPIALPYHRFVDVWTPQPSHPWTPPDPDDLADSADLPVADAPEGGWDDLRYPGE
jgi:hypothetical protein